MLIQLCTVVNSCFYVVSMPPKLLEKRGFAVALTKVARPKSVCLLRTNPKPRKTFCAFFQNCIHTYMLKGTATFKMRCYTPNFYISKFPNGPPPRKWIETETPCKLLIVPCTFDMALSFAYLESTY